MPPVLQTANPEDPQRSQRRLRRVFWLLAALVALPAGLLLANWCIWQSRALALEREIEVLPDCRIHNAFALPNWLIDSVGQWGDWPFDLVTTPTRIESLSLKGPSIDDAWLHRLHDWPGLRALELSETRVTDAGLSTVATLRDLEYLRLDSPVVTDRGLAGLSTLTRLKALRVWCPSVTGSAFRELAGLSDLEVLDLRRTSLNHEGYRELSRLASLESLHLPPTVSDEDLEIIATMNNLQILSMNRGNLTAAGLSRLRALPHLYYLSLRSAKLTDDALIALAASPSLTSLDLTGANASDRFLEQTAGHPWKLLRLALTHVTDKGMRFLPPSLTFLDLRRTGVTSEAVPSLARLSSLEHLLIADTPLFAQDFSPLIRSDLWIAGKDDNSDLDDP